MIQSLAPVVVALRLSADAKNIFRRPKKGWLRSVRHLYDLKLSEVAARRGITQQALLRAEVAEVQEGITIKNLRAIADAMGFDFCYCLIPRDRPPEKEWDARVAEAGARNMLDKGAADIVRALFADGADAGRFPRRFVRQSEGHK